LLKSKPNKLCHYTGVGALKGIVNEEAIWATQSLYLNDYKELKHAAQILSNQLWHYEISEDNDKIDFALGFKELLDHIDTYAERVYIASFSSNENQLSQWRGYTPANKGVSITFNIEVIQRLVDENSDFFIVPCQYNKDETEKNIENTLHNIFKEFKNEIKKNCVKELRTFVFSKLSDLLLIFASIKTCDFVEENEWRLIIIKPPKYSGDDLNFRESNSMLIPYIKVKLNPNSEERLFTFVLVGPSQPQNLLQSSISQFNRIKKFTYGLSSSGISYRDL
jgi:hypothetical protein